MAAAEVALSGCTRVVMYDGVCNACNRLVLFIIRRDPERHLLFCSLQSPKADPYLKSVGMSRREALRRLLFIREDGYSSGSTAALEVAGYMQHPWPMLKALLVVPLPLRDAVYDVIAERRYQWFGRSARCQVPPTDVLDRFLDAEELVQGRCSGEALPADPFREAREEVWQRWTRR